MPIISPGVWSNPPGTVKPAVKDTVTIRDCYDQPSLLHCFEKIVEINNQYQEKVSALRTRHATRREELFRKESQARLQQYQLAGIGTPPNNSAPADMSRGHRGYGPPGSVPVEPQRQYGSGQYDPYRRPESLERGRMQGSDTRVPTPNARAYNTGSRYY